MLVKLLSEQDKRVFLDIAELLSLSDKPLLWGGKASADVVFGSGMGEISIQRGEKESALLIDWGYDEVSRFLTVSSEAQLLEKLKGYVPVLSYGAATSIEAQLLEKLKGVPLQNVESVEARVDAAVAVLRNLLKEKSIGLPSVPKLMIFELMLLALADGKISSIEYRVLDEVRSHYKVEDFIFKDLLNRAEVSYNELQKTLSVIFE